MMIPGGRLARGSRLLALAIALVAIAAQQPAAAQPARAQPASVNEELVRLVQAHVDDAVIIDVIDEARGRYDSSIDAIIRLKTVGASDRVIAALRGVAGTPSKRSAMPAASAGLVSDVVIPDGTEVRLRLVERVTSATARVGDTVRFEVAQDVTLGDRVVIASGAPATGTVTVAESRKSFGRRGKLDFTIDTVRTVDDQLVSLRVTRRAEGESRYLVTGALTYFTVVGGVFVKGKDVEVDAGTQYVIYIDGGRRVGATSGATASCPGCGAR